MNTEIVFSFDSTGSMYPCLAQVRAQIKQTCQRLFRDIPNLRIGLIAHGDYCDAGSTYVTSILDPDERPETVSAFVQGVRPTHGGDAPGVLRAGPSRSADEDPVDPGSRRCFVLIGDDVPHGPLQNPDHIDWRTELAALAKASIPVYGVQCWGSHARPFYEERWRAPRWLPCHARSVLLRHRPRHGGLLSAAGREPDPAVRKKRSAAPAG